jgi:hypothetical protein
MATAINSSEIKLEYGVPEIFALKYVSGKNVEGRYGPRVLFTASDDRKLWLDAEDGSDLERGMRELAIQPGEFVMVTKIRHPRGGGHSIRVELAEESKLEQDLKRSIANARTREAAPPVRTAPQPQHQKSDGADSVARAEQPQSTTPASPTSVKFMGAYKAAIDILLESRVYAQRQGLALEIKCEDVRCLAATLIINHSEKGGAR